jgi:hypothetical protein
MNGLRSHVCFPIYDLELHCIQAGQREMTEHRSPRRPIPLPDPRRLHTGRYPQGYKLTVAPCTTTTLRVKHILARNLARPANARHDASMEPGTGSLLRLNEHIVLFTSVENRTYREAGRSQPVGATPSVMNSFSKGGVYGTRQREQAFR